MKRFLISILLSAAALGGCATKTATAPEKAQMAYGCPVGTQRIGSMEDLISAKVETAGNLKDIEVQEMRCIMEGDRLRIDTTLANSSSMVRRVAYRFDWIDRNGMKAPGDESWKPLYMYEGSRQTIVTTAPMASAIDFRLVLLDADKKR
jgi:uncharacterized protein YcfL